MDCLPYLARRSVLLSRETQQPWNTKYVEMLRERMFALVRAYFATTNAPLLELRERYHVTHLLVDRDYFANPPTYFKPFDDFIRVTFERARGGRFAALDAVPRAQVLAAGPYVLLDLSKL